MQNNHSNGNGEKYFGKTRRFVMGGIFLLIAFIIYFVFAKGNSPDAITTFNMTPGGSSASYPDWVFPTNNYLSVLAGVCLLLGAFQIVRGFRKLTNGVLALVVITFIFSFLAWAAADNSMNLAGLLRITIIRAVPLTLGGLSGILCERAGIINIAIEGMMLTAAFVSTVVASLSNLWIGMLSGILAGAFMAWILGVLSIKYKVNQVIAGTVINIFATGITSYLSQKFIQKTDYQFLNEPGMFPQLELPGLIKIPIIGPILFNHNIYIFLTIILVVVLTIALFHTKWGLRMRSVGEHPKAADTLGINVIKTRYMSVILGGMMAGFAGTYFTLGSSGRFDELLTAGRGYIGLAAMIFGNWNPIGTFGASILFGFFDALAVRASILNVPIPSEFLGMTPYIATMVVLAGLVGKGHAPAAEGTPYEKESL
ncbi:MAG: ral nucleoside transport system permease protein [Chloroflexota bacterium]|nr:ral nucleoside transport system permease protein [Chloroflexota bacterium]